MRAWAELSDLEPVLQMGGRQPNHRTRTVTALVVSVLFLQPVSLA